MFFDGNYVSIKFKHRGKSYITTYKMRPPHWLSLESFSINERITTILIINTLHKQQKYKICYCIIPFLVFETLLRTFRSAVVINTLYFSTQFLQSSFLWDSVKWLYLTILCLPVFSFITTQFFYPIHIFL